MKAVDWALPAADTYFRPLLKDDGFEVDHLLVALRYVRQWRTAVDGGAHIGTWSVEMANRFARVLAFEPAPDTYHCLSANLRGLLNVTPFCTALGATHSVGRMVDDTSRPGNTGARYLNPCGIGDVLIRPLDGYGLEDLDFLKLDVEGYELRALEGAAETLKRCRPVVLIEVKNFGLVRYGTEPTAAGEFLVAMGYREEARVRNDRIYLWGG